MHKKLAVLLLIILFAGCTQEGEVGVHNLSGGDISLEIDGRSYYLYPGDRLIRSIEIGKKCIFGPDETRVLVTGEGDCLFYFSRMVRVRNDETNMLPVYGDAGLLTVINNTLYALDLYISPCSDPEWGSPCDYIPPGWEVTWKLSPGCWDVLGEDSQGGYADATFNILVCDDAFFEIYDGLASVEAGTSGKPGIIIGKLHSGEDVKSIGGRDYQPGLDEKRMEKANR